MAIDREREATLQLAERADGVAAIEAADIQRMRLALAIERWPGDGAILYGAAQGFFLALVQMGEAETARRLHDSAGRKRFALSPIRVVSGQGNLARAELDVTVWDTTLAHVVEAGSATTLDTTLNVAGHPAHLLDVRVLARTTFAQLLDAPRILARRSDPLEGIGAATRTSGNQNTGRTVIWVRFTTPTLFSWGRGRDGHHRYNLLPAPELVVGSWLRAWNAGDGPSLPFHDEAEWLRERISIQAVRSLRTVTVHSGKSPLSGFVGEIALEWCGAQPGAHRTLRALAGFASYCGTGAKTAYGLGQTVTWQ